MNKFAAITFGCLVTMAGFTSAKASTPLELAMKKMSTAYKQLVLDLKQPADAGKPDYLALVATMKTQAQTARGLVPMKAADLPADQQTTMVTAYQKSMDDLGAAFDVLNRDIQNSQWDEATKQMAAIRLQMINGHKTFRKEEKKPVPVPEAAPAQPAPAQFAPTNAPPTPAPQ